MSRYFTFNTIVELTCLLVASICLTKDSNRAWRGMFWFLLITCVTEMTGIYVKGLYLADRAHVRPNSWVYNIFIIFEICFPSLMFIKILTKYANSKPTILCGLAIMYLVYVYEVITDGIFKKHNLTITLMAVLFVLYSLYYFYCLLKDESYINLKYSPAFWWVSGILFYYFGGTACNIFYNKLYTVIVTPKHYLTYYIYNALNLILYSCWSYSFICRKWLTKTSAA